jgi:hypothetical protein
MPKRLPDHWHVVSLQTQANDEFDTNPLGIAALKPVRDVHGAASARLACSAQKLLIPTAWRQFIVDEPRNAL